MVTLANTTERAEARGFSPAAAARHPKFVILVGGFDHFMKFWAFTGCFTPCFQVITLVTFVSLFTPKKLIFLKNRRIDALTYALIDAQAFVFDQRKQRFQL